MSDNLFDRQRAALLCLTEAARAREEVDKREVGHVTPIVAHAIVESPGDSLRDIARGVTLAPSGPPMERAEQGLRPPAFGLAR